ncbi:MAG: UMP kinase [Candidatus Kerfeldbacteria bacterium]|nr:UMP kinase [Candidatus Kerfeldbacteria bacterium]
MNVALGKVRRDRLMTLSIGGSIVAPDGIDVLYLKRLRALMAAEVRRGYRFLIAIGGGALARELQTAARAAGVRSETDLHWIGIGAVNVNSLVVQKALGRLADPRLYPAARPPARLRAPITMFVPSRPGRSTDTGAVRLAMHFHAATLFNLTNINYVYTKDPKRFSDAKPLRFLRWPAYWKLIPRRVTPGLQTPFDPVASRLAAAAGVQVVVLNGRNLKNVKRALDGRPFRGTVIRG